LGWGQKMKGDLNHLLSSYQHNVQIHDDDAGQSVTNAETFCLKK